MRCLNQERHLCRTLSEQNISVQCFQVFESARPDDLRRVKIPPASQKSSASNQFQSYKHAGTTKLLPKPILLSEQF